MDYVHTTTAGDIEVIYELITNKKNELLRY